MAKFDPKLHHRRSMRLPGYDYSQAGGYFVTMVTWQREFLFGNVVDGAMKLNPRGEIVDECWREIPKHFDHVELGAYVIMPNHIHGIIFIKNVNENRDAADLPHPVGATHASPLQKPKGLSSGTLGTIIGSFKSAVTKRIGREMNETGIWQRNYHEHIIRDEKDLQNKTNYINANPLLWGEDGENPRNVKA